MKKYYFVKINEINEKINDESISYLEKEFPHINKMYKEVQEIIWANGDSMLKLKQEKGTLLMEKKIKKELKKNKLKEYILFESENNIIKESISKKIILLPEYTLNLNEVKTLEQYNEVIDYLTSLSKEEKEVIRNSFNNYDRKKKRKILRLTRK